MTKSLYADRDTVGSIALDAAAHGERGVCAGDMGHELMPGLVADLNTSIHSKPFGNQEFYITVHETKDAQIPNMIRRRMVETQYRPFPEPNTAVWRHDPVAYKTLFCWAIPHWSVFDQCLANPDYYSDEQLADIKNFKAEKNELFGFVKHGKGWIPDPNFKDRELDRYKPKKDDVKIVIA